MTTERALREALIRAKNWIPYYGGGTAEMHALIDAALALPPAPVQWKYRIKGRATWYAVDVLPDWAKKDAGVEIKHRQGPGPWEDGE